MLVIILIAVPLQIPFVGSSEVGGVSINSLKDLVIALLLIAGIIVQSRSNNLRGVSLNAFYVLLITTFYFLLMLLISPSMKSGSLYFSKIMLLVLIALYAAGVNSFNWRFMHSATLYSLLGFILISIVVGFFRSGDTFEGITSRHFLKFNVMAGFLIAYCSILKRIRVPVASFLLVVSGVGLLLVMQRGLFIALFIGVLVAHMTGARSKFLAAMAGVLIIAGALVALFEAPWFREYAFYENYGPSQLFNSVLDGRFSLEMIRDRGRLQLISTMLASNDIGALGGGFGAAKASIEASGFFFAGKEPHNDFLMMLIDVGVIGLALLLVIIFQLIRRHNKAIKRLDDIDGRKDEHAAAMVLLLFSKGMLLGSCAWMFYSNVLIYSSAALVFPASLAFVMLRNNLQIVQYASPGYKNYYV